MAAISIRVRQLFVGPDYGAPGYIPPTGRVTLQLSTPLNDPAGNREYPNVPVTRYLDADGFIDIPVVATNCIGLDPSDGVFYVVTERITGSPKRSYQIEVPKESASGELWLADVAPALPGAQLYTYALQSALDAHLNSAHGGFVRPPGIIITEAPYSAVPGLTPQTTKFYQAAYDLAVDGGGRIWVPGAEWAVDGEFGVDMADFDNIEFWGEGEGATTIWNVDPDVMGAVLTFRSCKIPKVFHMRCDQYAAQADRVGLTNLYFLDCEDAEVAQVRVSRADNFGIWHKGGKGSSTHHCHIGYGYRLGGTADEFGGDGIHVGPDHPDGDIHANRVDGTGDDAIGITTEGALDCPDSNVHGNHVKRAGVAGISVWGGTTVDVSGNKVNGTYGEGIVVRVVRTDDVDFSPAVGVKVHHNVVQNAGIYADSPFFAGKAAAPGGIVIDTNDSDQYGDDLEITDNIIGDCRNNFIRVGSNATSQSDVRDVRVDNNRCIGTVFAGGLGGNSLSSGVYPGILIGKARDLSLVSNKVSNAPEQAIKILGHPTWLGPGVTGTLHFEKNVSYNCFTEADGAGTGNAWSIYSFGQADFGLNSIFDPNGHLGASWFFGDEVATLAAAARMVHANNFDSPLPGQPVLPSALTAQFLHVSGRFPVGFWSFTGADSGGAPNPGLGSNGDFAYNQNGDVGFSNTWWHKEGGAWVALPDA